MTPRPVGDQVLVTKIKPPTETAGGILLPEDSQRNSDHGLVMDVGKKVEEVKKGDEIVYAPYGPREFKHDNVEYLILKEEDVLAITKGSRK